MNAEAHVGKLFKIKCYRVVKSVCFFAQGNVFFYHLCALAYCKAWNKYRVKGMVADSCGDVKVTAQCVYEAHVVFIFRGRVTCNAVQERYVFCSRDAQGFLNVFLSAYSAA